VSDWYTLPKQKQEDFMEIRHVDDDDSMDTGVLLCGISSATF